MLCSRIMSTSDPNITVTYSSGTNEKLGTSWDVMHVVYHREEHGVQRIANSFVIARDLGGTIIRKTDIILDRWEVVRTKKCCRLSNGALRTEIGWQQKEL